MSRSVRPPQDITELLQTLLLREKDVLRLVRFSRATLWRRVRDKGFPARIKLSTGVTVWRTAEVLAWIESKRGD